MKLEDYLIWCFSVPRKRAVPKWRVLCLMFLVFVAIMCLCALKLAYCEDDGIWKITAYCSCVKCCGKSDGIMANGHKVFYGAVACNWLKFGTRVDIQGMGTFVVSDRGAKSLFGSRTNHIRHLDIYMPTHSQARQFGIKWLKVNILERGC